MLRFDRETDEPLPARARRRLEERVEAALGQVDGVVLEDYGKGVLHPPNARRLMRRIRDAGRPVAVDPRRRSASSIAYPASRSLSRRPG